MLVELINMYRITILLIVIMVSLPCSKCETVKRDFKPEDLLLRACLFFDDMLPVKCEKARKEESKNGGSLTTQTSETTSTAALTTPTSKITTAAATTTQTSKSTTTETLTTETSTPSSTAVSTTQTSETTSTAPVTTSISEITSSVSTTAQTSEVTSTDTTTEAPKPDNVTKANHTAFLDHTFDVVTANTEKECVEACMLRSACRSFNYKFNNNTCELNNKVMVIDNTSYIGNQPDSYYSIIDLYDKSIVGVCASHTCDQYSKCKDNGGSYTCTILYCSTPPVPYADIHVIPEFDLSVNLWRIGENLSYSCWTSYYPTTDWACLYNGTWQNPKCKALSTCQQLFSLCNPSYTDGIYVFKYPGTERDLIVECFISKPRSFLRIIQNSTFGYFATKYDPLCHPKTFTCGVRNWTVIELAILHTKVFIWPNEFLTTTDCDGPRMYGAGANCNAGCENGTVGELQIDIRDTGLKFDLPIVMVNGQLLSSENDQLLKGVCDACMECRINSNIALSITNTGSINKDGAVRPSCMSKD